MIKTNKARILTLIGLSLVLVASIITVCFLSGSIPAFAASNTQTNGKFTFTDNSLTTGKLSIFIDNSTWIDDSFGDEFSNYSRTYVAIKEGDNVLYSETSNWDKHLDGMQEKYDSLSKFTFAKQSFSIDVISLLENGQIVANTPYTLYCEAGTYNYFGMGEQYGSFGEVERISASFAFTLQAVSEMPPTPTKTGYTFTGWYTDKECTQLYTEDKVIGNVTLYAGFRPNNYTIHFDGNGKTSGTMSNLAMKYDTAANLTANAFRKTGYVFKGWATSAGGTVVYTDGQNVNNLTTADGKTVTLYAVWEQVVYWVHFNPNGGTGSMNNQEHTIDVPKKLANNLFERTGYTFKGWAKAANGVVVYTNMKSVTNLGAAGSMVELYAVWEINKLTIKFDATDGTGTIANQLVNYGESSTLTLVGTSMQREYYRFVGWATEQGGAVVYKDGDTITNNNTENTTMTLYAVWERVICYVTLIVDGQVYAIVEVECGTPTSDLFATANISTVLYKLDGDYPNALPPTVK